MRHWIFKEQSYLPHPQPHHEDAHLPAEEHSLCSSEKRSEKPFPGDCHSQQQFFAAFFTSKWLPSQLLRKGVYWIGTPLRKGKIGV